MRNVLHAERASGEVSRTASGEIQHESRVEQGVK